MQRLDGLDALKGIAIVLVVAIHAAPTEAPAYHEYVIRGVARLAVPLFLAISGFLVGSRPTQRTKLVLYFWKFLRLHVLYGALYWLLEPLRGMAYEPPTFNAALMHFAAYSYAGQFYLFVLPQIYFALAFLIPARLWSSGHLLVGSLALAAATVTALVWSFEAGTADPITRLVLGFGEASVCLWLFPFNFGIWLGARTRGRPASRAGAAWSLMLALVATTVVALDIPATTNVAYSDVFPYARWSILIGAAILAGAIPWASRSLRLAPIASLGRESFGIFVLNPLILAIWASRMGDTTTITESMVRTAATIAIAFVLSRGLRKHIPGAFP